MNMKEDVLDQMMGFDPSNLSAFNEAPETSGASDPNIYNTNPVKFSQSDDGHYHASIRIIYNPFNLKNSIIKNVKYSMRDQDGFFQATSSLSIGDKNCPIFKAWKKLHYAKLPNGEPDVARDNWAKEMFEKKESLWVLVQVIEDDNQPDTVGKIMLWKLPKTVYETLDAKMHPSPESKKTPVALMDYLFGPVLTLDVAPGPDDKDHPDRKSREISYTLCEFESDPTPIVNTDGSALFTDEEIEIIENYSALKAQIAKAKTEKAKKEKTDELEGMKDAVRELYKKALGFVKENAINIEDEVAYKPWDADLTARVNRWISLVADMKDPKATMITEAAPAETPTQSASEDSASGDPLEEVMGDNLPF